MTRTVRRIGLAAALLAGIASLISFGIVGIGRGGGERNFDGAVLYAAGVTWLHYGNPYDHEQLSANVHGAVNLARILFFYPPQAAGICVLLGLFKYSTAKLLWLAANLLSIAAIIALTACGLRRRAEQIPDEIGPWIMAAVIIGNPFTTHVVWMGQTSLVTIAATIAAFTFATGRTNRLAAGICLGIATFKPQLCLLLGVWFLLEREWKILLVAAATAVVMSLYPIMVEGPLGMLRDWHAAIQLSYSSLIYNAPGAPHKVGLDTFLQSAGIKVPSLAVTAVGIAATIFIWAWRKRFNPDDVLAILMGLTFIFVGYNHDYDYVGLIPVLGSLWYYAYRRPKAWAFVLPLVLLLFGPQRFVRGAGSPVLDQWRTLVVILLFAELLYFSARNRASSEAANGTKKQVKIGPNQ